MSKATCLEQVFAIVTDQTCSWFDYEIMKDVVDYLGEGQEKKQLEQYEANFKIFAEQRLPKGKRHIEVGNGARNGGKQLVIKIDKEWDEVNFNDLDKIRGNLANILEVRKRDLYLADIREGCIMMTFMITKELAESLFPKKSATSSKLSNYLTASQIKSLKEEGVILFTCDKSVTWRSTSEQKEAELESSESSRTGQQMSADEGVTGEKYVIQRSTAEIKELGLESVIKVSAMTLQPQLGVQQKIGQGDEFHDLATCIQGEVEEEQKRNGDREIDHEKVEEVELETPSHFYAYPRFKGDYGAEFHEEQKRKGDRETDYEKVEEVVLETPSHTSNQFNPPRIKIDFSWQFSAPEFELCRERIKAKFDELDRLFGVGKSTLLHYPLKQSLFEIGGPAPATTKEDDGQIPGLHEYLPKSEIRTVMNNYLGADGWYLLRPSSTSEGQLTLAVSHGGRILNFKINGEGSQFYIAPKKRFNSVRALLDYYKTSPIRNKKYGKKILLLNPIPVDRKQEDMFKQKLEQKVAKKPSKANLLPEPLPEPWQEHYDECYKRCYYYNPQTGQSSWKRPKAPPTTTPSSLTTPTTPSSQKGSKSPRLPSRTESMLGRPLPATPGSVSTGDEISKSRRMSDVSGSMSPRTRKAQQPLPAIPGEKEETSNAHPIKSHRRNTENKINVVRHVPDIKETPALPSKDVPAVPGRAGSRGSLPALPPKEDSPSHAGRSPSMNRRAQMPLPEEPVNKFQRKAIPSLPPKEPEKASPRLPQRQSNGSIPPLPPKEMSPPIAQEAEKPLPPLPPKSKSPSPPPKVEPPPSSNRKPRKKIVEYEDFPIRQPKAKANVPPLPEKEDKGAAAAPPPPPLPVANGAPPPPTINGSGGAPPPPPPPPVGMPVPPPPPPNAPPSPNPAAASSRRAPAAEKRSQSTSSEEGGRPFTANDLAQAKTLLKKRKESPEEDRRSSAPNSGIAGVFANAIDSRITSIRKAMVDSDSEESEFEDIDDDDWDD